MTIKLRDIVAGLILLTGVAACTWSGVGVSQTEANLVYVAGQPAHVTPAQVARLAAPYMGVPFFDVDIHAMAADLQALPWLANVSVDRHWPDGVVIRVTEHRPIARWDEGDLLMADYTVAAPDDQGDVSSLPHLFGPTGTGQRVYTRYKQMSRYLSAAGHARIARMTLTERGTWRVMLADGLVLRLGRDHLKARLRRFVNYGLVQVGDAIASAGYVDLRYSDGFAVGGKRDATAVEKG